MTSIVINSAYGGFGLSKQAEELFEKVTGKAFDGWECPRHDPTLIKIVQDLGDAANGCSAKLEIVEIKSNRYRITEYDGWENIETPDNVEWVVIDETPASEAVLSAVITSVVSCVTEPEAEADLKEMWRPTAVSPLVAPPLAVALRINL